MTTQPTATDLAQWLMERITEDEAVAERAGSFTPWSETFQTDNYGHLTIQPARVLATCAAHRRIVEEHYADSYYFSDVLHCGACAGWEDADYDGPPHVSWPCPTLRALATIYADHEGFREEWKA